MALPRRISRADADEVAYARGLFKQGLPLIGMVNRELALDLDLFSRGGMEILRAIERRDYDVLIARPSISKALQGGSSVAGGDAPRCFRH